MLHSQQWDVSTGFQKIALIGLGLIGSSIGQAIIHKNIAQCVSGYDKEADTLQCAFDIKCINKACNTAAEAVKDADIVIICVPVGEIKNTILEILSYLKEGAIITDVGSTKQSVCDHVYPLLPSSVQFVPAHPVAGTQFTGPEAGMVELFENRWCILCPSDNTKSDSIAKIRSLWERMGAWVEIMTPSEHDMILAVTSHIPHVIAYTMMLTAVRIEEEHPFDIAKFSAGGFRSATRIACSSPIMVRDILLHNSDAILGALREFSDCCKQVEQLIINNDGDSLLTLLEDLQKERLKIP